MNSMLFNQQLDELTTRLTRTEFDFASSAPMVGPIIQGFRRLWNNISTRWYVMHTAKQQVVFDTQMLSLVKQLTEYTQKLEEQNVKLERRLNDLQQLHELDMKVLTQPVYK